jgi:hypothetical protein
MRTWDNAGAAIWYNNKQLWLWLLAIAGLDMDQVAYSASPFNSFGTSPESPAA